MGQYWDAFKEGLKLVPSRLFRFIKKLVCNLFIYGPVLTIPLIIAFGIMFLVKILTQDTDIAIMAFKIFATIGQIIPLTISLYVSENEFIKNNEDSSELCFAICVVIIGCIWIM